MGGSNPNSLGYTGEGPAIAGGASQQNFANTNQMLGLPVEQMAQGLGTSPQAVLGAVNNMVAGGEAALVNGAAEGMQANAALDRLPDPAFRAAPQPFVQQPQQRAPQQYQQQPQQQQPFVQQPQQMQPIQHQPIQQPQPQQQQMPQNVVQFPTGASEQNPQPASINDLQDLRNIMSPAGLSEFQTSMQPPQQQVLYSDQPGVPPVVPQQRPVQQPAPTGDPAVRELAEVMKRREELELQRMEQQAQSQSPEQVVLEHINRTRHDPQYRALAMTNEGLDPNKNDHHQIFEARVQNAQLEVEARQRQTRIDALENQFSSLETRAQNIAAKRRAQKTVQQTFAQLHPAQQQEVQSYMHALVQQGVSESEALQRVGRLIGNAGSPQPQQPVAPVRQAHPGRQQQLQALTVGGQGAGQFAQAQQQPLTIEGVESQFLGGTQYNWGY